MPQAAWEAMLADALHPQGVQPRNLPAPQDHPYVVKRLRENLQEANEKADACGTSPKPNPAHTHPLATPQASTHRHWQHLQHPGSPARHTARRV